MHPKSNNLQWAILIVALATFFTVTHSPVLMILVCGVVVYLAVREWTYRCDVESEEDEKQDETKNTPIQEAD
jgi:chromate transport protein ChrA